MEDFERHKLVFKIVTPIGRVLFKFLYGMEFEPLTLEEPSILICNHVTNIDPIYLACCLKDSHTYFVGSEHIARMGRLTKMLEYFASFIPQKKGKSAMATVKSCIRHTRDGHSVAIFAEGNTTWDGISDQIFPATGKLIKMAGVPLVTFRIDGAYLSTPRWRKGIRRGRIKIHPVRTYSVEEIKGMTFDEINAAIEKDIYTNIWEEQKASPAAYSGGKRSDGLERALFMCPDCRKIGTLHSDGNVFACQCGFEVELDKYGFFKPEKPFATIHEWDQWQKEELAKMKGSEGMEEENGLFSDTDVSLYRIDSDHEMEKLGVGMIRQFYDKLVVGENIFPIDKIEGMAIVNTKRLLFTCEKIYYEVRGRAYTNMRKYFLYYHLR